MSFVIGEGLQEWYTIKVGGGHSPLLGSRVFDRISSPMRAFEIAQKYRHDPTLVIERHRDGKDYVIDFYGLEQDVKGEHFFQLAHGQPY